MGVRVQINKKERKTLLRKTIWGWKGQKEKEVTKEDVLGLFYCFNIINLEIIRQVCE